MQTLTASLEFKATEDGVIEGYGAVFGNTDRDGDVLMRGAFAESLATRGAPRMLWQHAVNEVIGVWDEAEEDARGLRLRGRLALKTPRGREVAELVSMGAVSGLSIGYRTEKASRPAGMDVRMIEKAELWEVSVVTFPANDLSRIDAMKAADMTRRDFEQVLMHNAGFSRSVARRLLAGGHEAVKAMHDAGDDGLDELRAALAARVSVK